MVNTRAQAFNEYAIGVLQTCSTPLEVHQTLSHRILATYAAHYLVVVHDVGASRPCTSVYAHDPRDCAAASPCTTHKIYSSRHASRLVDRIRRQHDLSSVAGLNFHGATHGSHGTHGSPTEHGTFRCPCLCKGASPRGPAYTCACMSVYVVPLTNTRKRSERAAWVAEGEPSVRTRPEPPCRWRTPGHHEPPQAYIILCRRNSRSRPHSAATRSPRSEELTPCAHAPDTDELPQIARTFMHATLDVSSEYLSYARGFSPRACPRNGRMHMQRFLAPLDSIITTTHLMQCTEPSPAQGRLVDIVRRASMHMVHIVSDILDICDLLAEDVPTHLTDVDLRQLLCETRDIALADDLVPHNSVDRRQDQGADQCVGIHVTPRVPAHITTDARHIKHILVNVLAYAVRASTSRPIDVHVDVSTELKCGEDLSSTSSSPCSVYIYTAGHHGVHGAAPACAEGRGGAQGCAPHGQTSQVPLPPAPPAPPAPAAPLADRSRSTPTPPAPPTPPTPPITQAIPLLRRAAPAGASADLANEEERGAHACSSAAARAGTPLPLHALTREAPASVSAPVAAGLPDTLEVRVDVPHAQISSQDIRRGLYAFNEADTPGVLGLSIARRLCSLLHGQLRVLPAGGSGEGEREGERVGAGAGAGAGATTVQILLPLVPAGTAHG